MRIMVQLSPVPNSAPQQGVETAEMRLPRNVEAEAALIGAMLIDNRISTDIETRLTEDHFFEPLHGRLFRQIRILIDRGMVVTPVTLKPLFEGDETLQALGGTGYLAKLTESSVGLIGARDFARQIYDLALLRELVSVGRNLVTQALDTSESVDPKQQIEQAEAALYRVSEGDEEQGGVKRFHSASTEALQLISKAMNAGGGLSGVTTGIQALNQKLGGLHHSDLTILAGRPAMGKTSLATNLAFNAADRWRSDLLEGIDPTTSVGAPVAFFSLEMSADQLATRILAEQSGISSEKLRKGIIDKNEFMALARAAQKLEDLPLFIDDTPALTIAALRARARRMKKKHEIGLIIIDYLQLLAGTGRGDNRVNEISEISRGLKTLAKELNVPVIALSQLSRQVESREDKRPQLSDLRESGSIEQDADIVLFIFRGEYYHLSMKPDEPDERSGEDVLRKYREWEEKHLELVGRATVIVAKQRHGSTGNVPLRFDSETTRFSDLPESDWNRHDYGPEE